MNGKTKSFAIDGPAGAGKSSVAKTVAKMTGLTYVDSGAIYRTCALYFIDNHGEQALSRFSDEQWLRGELQKFDIDFSATGKTGFTVLLNGEDVGARIRTEAVSRFVPKVASLVPVREKVNERLRAFAATHAVIMDGRDIGTCVLPDSMLKVFLTARPEVRARRRFDELVAKGEKADLPAVLADVIARDEMDERRPVAPLKKADDAVLVDTSEMTEKEVVDTLAKMASEKFGA